MSADPSDAIPAIARLRQRLENSPSLLPSLLLAAAALSLLLEFGGLWVQRSWNRPAFVSFGLLQGLVYAAAVCALGLATGGRPTTQTTNIRPAPGFGSPDRLLLLILAAAVILRIGPLFGPVTWSTDIYRYVWDGWVQADGINPYRYVPADQALAHLRDSEVYPLINRREFARTIYPAFAELVFAAQAWLGGTVFSMKVWMVVFEFAGIAVMVRLLLRLGRSAYWVLIYAWHPLPIWEIAGSGHVDALLVFLAPLALLGAVLDRRILAGIAFGAAVITKFIPLVIAPALWRRGDWRMPLAALAFVAVCYLPYLGIGWQVLGYLPGYLDEENIGLGRGSGFWILDTLQRLIGQTLPDSLYLGFCAALIAMMGLIAMRRIGAREPNDVNGAMRNEAESGERARWAMALALATVVLFSPHYAWYFVWVITLLALSPWAPGLWPTLTALLLYWAPEGGRIPTWVGAVMYGGFVALAAASWGWNWWRRRALQNDQTCPPRAISRKPVIPSGPPK